MLSPNAKGGTQIPYYQGEYAVEKIQQVEQKEWLDNAQKIILDLPTNNIWKPEDLSIVEKQHNGQAIQLIKHLGHSVWFAQSAQLEEPKASFKLQFNSDISDQSASNRVTMNLLLAMLNKQFSELNFVTQEAGLNFKVTQADGLFISTSGYSDKQDKLLLHVVEHISNARFSEQSLQLAKQELQRRLNNKGKIKAMNLAFDGFRQVVRQPAWSDATLLAAITSLTIKDIEQFRDQIFKQSTLRLLALGNLTKLQVLALDKKLTQKISVQTKDFYSIKRLQADLKQGVLNYALQSEMKDDALLMVHLSDLKGKQALATSELLNKLIQPAFYDQIRTQEQLSYSPFTASFNVDDHATFGLFTQSSVANNSELYDRFKQFLAHFKGQLADTTEDKFAQIKETHIANYMAKATSLQDEFGYLTKEWLALKTQINNKNHYIETLSGVSLQQVLSFYNDVLITDKSRQVIIVQVQGKKSQHVAPLIIENQVLINNIDQLQK
jgi:protease-3